MKRENIDSLWKKNTHSGRIHGGRLVSGKELRSGEYAN